MFEGIMALPNAGEVVERLADTQPLIRTIPRTSPGLRSYSLGQFDPSVGNAVTVTEVGHWFHVADKLADESPVPSWTCRGCRVVATSTLLDPQLGRCAHPASQQDIATALLGRQAVAL